MKTLLTLIALTFSLQALPCENSAKLLPYVQVQLKKQMATTEDVKNILGCVLTDPDYQKVEMSQWLSEVVYDMAIHQPLEMIIVANVIDYESMASVVKMLEEPINDGIDLKSALFNVLQVRFLADDSAYQETKMEIANAIYAAVLKQ